MPKPRPLCMHVNVSALEYLGRRRLRVRANLVAEQPDAKESLEDAAHRCDPGARVSSVSGMQRLGTAGLTGRNHMRDWRGDLDGQESCNADQEAKDALMRACESRARRVAPFRTYRDRRAGQEGTERPGTVAAAGDHVENRPDFTAQDDKGKNDDGGQEVRVIGQIERAADHREAALDDNRMHSSRHRGRHAETGPQDGRVNLARHTEEEPNAYDRDRGESCR